MDGQVNKQAGDALAAALGAGFSPAGAAAGRTLLLALVNLHRLGALEFSNDPEAVHQTPSPQGSSEAVVGFGEAEPSETAHAYNMGSLFTSPGDTE